MTVVEYSAEDFEHVTLETKPNLPTFGRKFNEARKDQGFRDQAHLDAFYRYYDHTQTCPVCSCVAGYAPIDDGMQPYMGQCDQGRELLESF